MAIYVQPHAHVDDEAAWSAAAKAQIESRAAKKKERLFREANPDAEAILEYIDKRAFTWATDDDWRRVKYDEKKLEPRTFIDKLKQSILKWGAPTQGQADAVRRMIDQDAAKKAEWAARDARSEHIGEVGKKIEVEAFVTFQTGFSTQFGYTTITGFRVGDNVIIHKGTAPSLDDGKYCDQWGNRAKREVAKGDRVTLKATVKEHGERDGVKQTIVIRPKVALIGEGA